MSRERRANERAREVEPPSDLGALALAVGLRMQAVVLEALHEAGFPEVRASHEAILRELERAPRAVTALAERLGVSQQAASKVAAELEALGYVDKLPTVDARVRQVALSPRGRNALLALRTLRGELGRTLEESHGVRAIADAKRLLGAMLDELGGEATPGRGRANAE
jgi:DNA-binding MarR family transcriptional regulator